MAARSFPVVGDLLAFQADRLGFVTEQHRRQGDVARYRLGPYRVWQLAHPDHVRDVLVTHADRFGKSVVLQRARIILGDGLLTSEGDVHDRHRHLIQPAFHSRRITGYAEVMIDQAAATAGRWGAHEPVDIHAEAVRMTLTTAGRTLLGADVDADVATVERAVSDVLSAYKLAFLPFGGSLARLPLGPGRKLRRGRASLHGLVERVVAERASTGHDSGDLLSALVLAAGDDRLDDVAIRDEAVTLLLAGHETAANTLTFAFHLLGRNPAVEARVHREVDEVLGGATPQPDDVDRLPLCRAVVAEALRLYPPSWMMGRQAIEDHQLGGRVVAAGDLVVLPQWVVHRDARWWPEPQRCLPGRWLSEQARRERPRWAFFPFGAGLRRCIGEGFAWTETVLALATIVRRWRLRPIAGSVRLDPLITLRPRGRVRMSPEPRSRQSRSDR